MFPLTRPMRQTLATIALVGLTVIPTGVVATIAWRINRPGHVRDVEIELGLRNRRVTPAPRYVTLPADWPSRPGADRIQPDIGATETMQNGGGARLRRVGLSLSAGGG